MATKATQKAVTRVSDDEEVSEETVVEPTPKAKPEPKPGDADFDWSKIYVEGTELKRYEDPSGMVVCLPPIPAPDAGDMFADLLIDLSDQAILFKLIRQAVRDNAIDYSVGLYAVASAFRGGDRLDNIEALLKFWSGSKLPK